MRHTLCLSILFALLLIRPTTGPHVYYVAPDGHDEAPGSKDKPWATIQHAAETMGPGDTVYVRGGSYPEEVEIAAGGEADAPIVYAAYPGETVILNGGDRVRYAAFTIRPGVSHIRLQGFTVRDYQEVAVSLEGGNSDIEVASLSASGAGSGGVRLTWGLSGQPPDNGAVDHVVIRDSHLHDNDLSGIDCTPGPCHDLLLSNLLIENNGLTADFAADGIAVERGQRIRIEQVRVLNNGGDGIDLNSRDRAPVEGILVSRCLVAGNLMDGLKLWAGGRVENSVVHSSGGTPLALAAFSGVHLELINNTIAYNMWDPAYATRGYAMAVGYPEPGEPAATNVHLTMTNNIFAFNTGPQVGTPTGLYLGPGVILTEGYNLYYSRDDCEIEAQFSGREEPCYSRAEIAAGTWTADTGQGRGNRTDDPRLVSGPPAPDLRLAANSPAIDAGTAEGAPRVDMEGLPRPGDSAPDLGAYEHSVPEPC